MRIAHAGRCRVTNEFALRWLELPASSAWLALRYYDPLTAYYRDVSHARRYAECVAWVAKRYGVNR